MLDSGRYQLNTKRKAMDPTTPPPQAPNDPEPSINPVPPPAPQPEPTTNPAPPPSPQPETIAPQPSPSPVFAAQFQSAAATSPAAPATDAPALATEGSIPAQWPGAFGLYKYSKKTVRVNLSSIVLVFIIDIVVTIALKLVLKSVGEFIGILISPLQQAVMISLYFAGVHEQKMPLGQAFSKGLRLWPKMFILYIMFALSLAISFLLLIIPFFFVFPRLLLANYFLVDKNMGPLEAYKASWHASKGNIAKLYGIVGVNLLLPILMITIIGIPFSIYFLIMYGAAFAVLYVMIAQQSSAVSPNPAAPAPIAPASPPTPPGGFVSS
jgi:hypothetical protein